MELNTIFNEDCLEGMKRLPDGVIDMVCCDLPFGTTDNEWDRVIPFEPLWEQYLRVCKENAAIVLFGQLPFGSDLIQSQKKLYRYEWIFEKSCAVGFLNAKKMPMRAHENILVFYRKLPTYNPQMWESSVRFVKRVKMQSNCYHSRSNYDPKLKDYNTSFRFPRDVIKVKSPSNLRIGRGVLHPTEKPVDLIEYLIRTYTNAGELVLDNCMGSGTTAVACVNADRHFIGFETNASYCEIAERRIAAAVTDFKAKKNRLTRPN